MNDLDWYNEESNVAHWLDARKSYKWLMKSIWYGRKGYERLDIQMNGMEMLPIRHFWVVDRKWYARFINMNDLDGSKEEWNANHWCNARKSYKWIMKCIQYGRKGYWRMDMEMNGMERLWSDHLFHHRLERFQPFYRLCFL